MVGSVRNLLSITPPRETQERERCYIASLLRTSMILRGESMRIAHVIG